MSNYAAMQTKIRDLILRAVPDARVVMYGQEISRGDDRLVVWSPLSPPQKEEFAARDSRRVVKVVDRVELSLGGPVDASSQGSVRVQNMEFFIRDQVTGVSTLENMASEINYWTQGVVATSDDIAGELELREESPGALFGYGLSRGSSFSEVLGTESDYVLTSRVRMWGVNVQSYAKSSSLAGGATKMTQDIEDVFESRDVSLEMGSRGVVPMVPAISSNDLSGFAGPDWESRSSVVLRFKQTFFKIEPANLITGARVDVTGRTA